MTSVAAWSDQALAMSRHHGGALVSCNALALPSDPAARGPIRLAALPNGYWISGSSIETCNGIYRIVSKVQEGGWLNPLGRCKALKYRNEQSEAVLEWVEDTGGGVPGWRLAARDDGPTCFGQRQSVSRLQVLGPGGWFVPPHSWKSRGARVPDEVVMLMEKEGVDQLVELKRLHDQRVQKAKERLEPPAEDKILPLQDIGCWVYKVVHRSVAVRAEPKVDGRHVGTRYFGERVRVHRTAHGDLWLRVSWDGCPRGELWMPRDGSKLGYEHCSSCCGDPRCDSLAPGLMLERAQVACSAIILDDPENALVPPGLALASSQPPEPGEHVCAGCGVGFSTPMGLKRHQRADACSGQDAVDNPLLLRRRQREARAKAETEAEAEAEAAAEPELEAETSAEGDEVVECEGEPIVVVPQKSAGPDRWATQGLASPVDVLSELGQAWSRVVLPASPAESELGVESVRAALAGLESGEQSVDGLASELGLAGEVDRDGVCLELWLMELAGLLNGNRLIEAEAALRRLQAAGGQDPRVCFWAGRAALVRGRRDHAIRELGRAGEPGAELTAALEQLSKAKQAGNQAFKFRMWPAATRAYEAALGLDACQLDTHMQAMLLCNSAGSLRMQAQFKVCPRLFGSHRQGSGPWKGLRPRSIYFQTTSGPPGGVCAGGCGQGPAGVGYCSRRTSCMIRPSGSSKRSSTWTRTGPG